MSFFDTLLGNDSADAARRAASDTFQKQTAATGELKAFGDNYANSFANLAGSFSPYANAGASAIERLLAGLGLGGDSSGFTAAYRSTPGYQAGMDAGTNAVTAGANAGNMLNSGKTLKALQRFGSDYEDNRFQQYLQNLSGVAGIGQQATGQQVATTAQGLQGQLATRQSAYGGDMNAAATIGQGEIAAAQSQSDALGRLMGVGAYLGGSLLGGGFGSSLGTKLFGTAAAPAWPTGAAKPFNTYGR